MGLFSCIVLGSSSPEICVFQFGNFSWVILLIITFSVWCHFQKIIVQILDILGWILDIFLPFLYSYLSFYCFYFGGDFLNIIMNSFHWVFHECNQSYFKYLKLKPFCSLNIYTYVFVCGFCIYFFLDFVLWFQCLIFLRSFFFFSF